MSHEQDKFDVSTPDGVQNLSFEEREALIANKYEHTSTDTTSSSSLHFYSSSSSNLYVGTHAESGWAKEMQDAVGTSDAGSMNRASEFFKGIDKSTNPLSTSWEGLLKQFRDFAATVYNGTSPYSSPFEGPAFERLFAYYSERITGTFNSLGELSVINQADSNLGISITLDDPTTSLHPEYSLKNQFVNAMDHFLANITYAPDGSLEYIPLTTNDHFSQTALFTQSLSDYLTNIATIDQSTGAPHDTNTIGSSAGIPSYEEVYESYFGNTDNYANLLAIFYKDQLVKNSSTGVAKGGFFIPSQSFNDWVNFVNDQYIFGLALLADPLSNTSPLEAVGFKKVLLLDRLFLLLVEMIEVLQKVAVAQSDHLTFLTKWQKVYTEDMAEIPAAMITDTAQLSAVDGLAQQFNSQLGTVQDALRSFRSVVGDQAKRMQTNINQTNDAVNQQTAIATAIIQQFSTILGAIFR